MPFLEKEPTVPEPEPNLPTLLAQFRLPGISYREETVAPAVQAPETKEPESRQRLVSSIGRAPDGRATEVSINNRRLMVLRDENDRFCGLEEVD